MDCVALIKKYCPDSPDLFSILIDHSRNVADKALQIADTLPSGLDVDKEFIHDAAMLHDIGIVRCNASKIFCSGTEPYIRHGILGREILEHEGLKAHALICERHVGAGLSRQEIIDANLPLPHRDMVPVSTEEIIICVADKFFSKSRSDKEHKIDKILKEISGYGSGPEQRFRAWLKLLGIKDK